MNPWDARLYEELGRYGAAVLPAFEGVGEIDSEVEFEQAKGAVEAAIALCPEAAGLYAQKGTLWDIRADLLFGRREHEKDENRKERLDRRHRAAVAAALEAYDAAVERYPTRAWYRFLRAVAYGRQGRFAEEREDLRKALELHAVQDLERLRLPGDIVQGIGERLKEIGSVEPAPPRK
jgi:tetratricopeptide (TPR) repeat protein